MSSSNHDASASILLSFHDIDYTATLPLLLRKKGQSKHRQILFSVNGICRPGEVTAILGSTGSGKSTLLDVLAGRKSPNKLGPNSVVLLNGQKPGSDFHRFCGYCEQNDSLLGTLTVRESLIFSAELRLAATPDERKKRVEDVIVQLGLEKCADTFVGTELIRGISGGEKKRTNLGRELVNNPSLIFLDEPTTGIDSSHAQKIVQVLADLAHTQNKTVVLSIHQPKYSIFKLFDSLILLDNGRVAYHGPALQAIPYFEGLGYKREPSNNPADWFLEILVNDHDELEGGGRRGKGVEDSEEEDEEAKSVETVEEPGSPLDEDTKEETMVVITMEDGHVAAAVAGSGGRSRKTHDNYQPILNDLYLKSSTHRKLQEELQEIRHRTPPVQGTLSQQGGAYATSFYQQFKILCKRTLISCLRNPASASMQFGAMIFFIVLIGGIYWKMDLGATGLQNRVGCFFLLVMMCMFSNLSALELFIEERGIFLNEKANGFYRTSAYFLSRAMCDIVPLRLIPGLAFCSVIYWMLGLRGGVAHFAIFTYTSILTMLTAAVGFDTETYRREFFVSCLVPILFFPHVLYSAGICLFFSSLIPIFAVANLGVALFYILFMVTGGTLINFNQLPGWLTPFKYISLFRYAMETLTVNELYNLPFTCDSSEMMSASVPIACSTYVGNDFLRLQDFPAYSDLWKNLLIITSMFIIYMSLTYMSLRRLKVDN